MSRTHLAHTASPTVYSLPLSERLIAVLRLFSLLGLVVALLMFSVAHARAASEVERAPELAALPMPQAPVTIAAGCDAGVAVFTVQNNTSRWTSRGFIRVADGQTGAVLRERELALGERQKASFRVAASDAPGEIYRVLVRMPDSAMTYVKSFSGRCG